MSGWQTDFVQAPVQLNRQRHRLLALVGQRLTVGWTGWELERNWWHPNPIVLAFDSGIQLEIAWQTWDDLSITWNTVDLAVPPTILDRPGEWRASEPDPVAPIADRVVTGFAVVRSPYFNGDLDLAGPITQEDIAGWYFTGLWIEFGDVGLLVYNHSDDNGVSSRPERPEAIGVSRVDPLTDDEIKD